MIPGLIALCVVVMRCFPETPLAKALHKALVEAPLLRLSKMTRRHIIFALVIVALFLTAGEFVAVFGSGELLMLGLNLSIYLDAVLVATAVTIAAVAVTVWRGARARLAIWLARIARPSTRSVRENRPRKPRHKSTDDDGDPAWDFAFAT